MLRIEEEWTGGGVGWGEFHVAFYTLSTQWHRQLIHRFRIKVDMV